MDLVANSSVKELPSQLKAMAFMQPKSMGHFKRPKQNREEQKPKRKTEVLALAQEVLEREDSAEVPSWLDRKQTLGDSKTLLKSRIQIEEKQTKVPGKPKALDLRLDVPGSLEVDNLPKPIVAQTVSQPQLKPLQKMFLEHKLPVLQTPSKQSKVQQLPQPSYFSNRSSLFPSIVKQSDKNESPELRQDSATPKIKVSGSSSKRPAPQQNPAFQMKVSKLKAFTDRHMEDTSLSNLLSVPKLMSLSQLKAQSYYLSKLNKGLTADDPVVKMQHSEFAEHFAKNFIEMKNMKQDRLLVDYHTKPVQLPPSVHSHLLVLDLDETLVHCVNFDGRTTSATETVPFRPLGAPSSSPPGFVKFNRRPGLDKFLKNMAEHFQIVVFTASDRAYARAVLNQIDPDHHVCKLLCRESCSFTKSGNVVKDLRLFHGKQLQNIVLVDNSSKCFYPQVDNGIPILSYFDDSRDCELEDLGQFLLALKKSSSDFPKSLREYFQLYRYHSASSHTQMAWEIFSSMPTM